MISDCDAKLVGYRSALDAGADPIVVAGWITEVQAQRAMAGMRAKPSRTRRQMSEAEIAGLVTTLGGIRTVLERADPEDKAEVYRRLGLRLRFQHEQRTVRADIDAM